MKICMNDIMYALSYALDSVEAELIGGTRYHSRRVALIAVRMGKVLHMNDGELLKLAAASVLHDNALTEYNLSEAVTDPVTGLPEGNKVEPEVFPVFLMRHCVIGERNLSILPFYQGIHNVIRYHHECADGSGPFGKKASEVPCFAKLVHLADQTDIKFDLSDISEEKYRNITAYIQNNTGVLFDGETAGAFLAAFPYEKTNVLHGEKVSDNLRAELPVIYKDYTEKDLMNIAALFAKIVDYKSSFTHDHSLGVAEKARRVAADWGYSSEQQAWIYFAGALHDIGKLVIKNDVLEKPARLTSSEYQYVQTHAFVSWQILNFIAGMKEIASWAGLHHEKLDGSGYPFGKTAKELGRNERLMVCIDIYQALTEKRPYKDGITHEEAISIMNDMVSEGKIDAEITADIDRLFSVRALQHTR